MNKRTSPFAGEIANSAGLWIFLFCAVGLAGLFMAESKFRERMQRQAQRIEVVTATPAAAGQPAPTAPMAAPDYGLAGLRWMLGGGVVLGLVLLVVTIVRWVRTTRGKKSDPSFIAV